MAREGNFTYFDNPANVPDPAERLENEYGIPLRCVDCPGVAPTLDEVRDLESTEFILQALLENEDELDRLDLERFSDLRDHAEYLKARKMLKLTFLIGRTAGCYGVVLSQAKTPADDHIHHIGCGC